MTLQIPFDNSYAALPPAFYSRQVPIPVAAPRLLAFNRPLADLLGLSDLPDEAALARIFSGNEVPAGATPLAQAYAGHQFGGFSPRLGDGRALLLGETLGTDGLRRDIALKGSGPTPYSRRGDGRAWMGPVLREYVVSEAMYALGIPTTRALAAVATGETIYRETALPGAILTRVAQSHIRVGTFEYFAARGDRDGLQQLYDHTRARHYPEAETPLELLQAVIARQASLIAQWMAVGFIHGVMNTDNCQVAGETIDYGPCAFMDTWHPDTVYSSIDHQGRYAYSNQPHAVTWNLAKLASALVSLEADPQAAVPPYQQAIEAMPGQITAQWLARFRAKIGLTARADSDTADAQLIADLLDLMQAQKLDFTNTFRALSGPAPRDAFLDRDAFDGWNARWQARLVGETTPQARMEAANPWIIPRNHRMEEMISAAVAGDMAPFHRLMEVLATPYRAQPAQSSLTLPPTEDQIVPATYCGT
ncbi:protein adenylyltransferase SelO [Pseudooceanicola nanhaiensis]|uniref:protein adenylyltransferase SelO n=1 Tax=Pseudooceanicola nanhaiensis TaxID=375761 RepID=UPI001CD29D98|nr:YdiU family protein [Pseudooceanicola nanhaiensis]MCA0920947.1 YdiU family protein [Pseudooceanicola nanhaiensis]